MSTASGIFGGNSDGAMRMEEWLLVMCRGCVRDRGRAKSGMGGFGCDLPGRALSDPYGADIPEWSQDAAPKPARFSDELSRNEPWPVCMAYIPRKRRSDAGQRRGPRFPVTQPGLF